MTAADVSAKPVALKPCPFCGCAATFVKHSSGMPTTQGYDQWNAVACKHCRATVGACDRRFRTNEDARDVWNLRVYDAAAIKQARMEGMMHIARNVKMHDSYEEVLALIAQEQST